MEVDKTEDIKNKILDDWNEEKTKIEWEAPERAFQKRDKDFWVTAIAILILVSVILVFVKEFFLIIALVSILFLYYVMSTIEPGNIKYKITNRAIYFGEPNYEWDLLTRFWFKKSLSSEMIHFETKLRFPRQVSLVINKEDKEKIKEIVLKKLPMVEYSPNFIDKLTKWFADRLPLEKKKTEKKA
ncbi:MAG: hypothetical protein WDA13_01885 [Candidatus Shapirobacteria bacterium]